MYLYYIYNIIFISKNKVTRSMQLWTDSPKSHGFNFNFTDSLIYFSNERIKLSEKPQKTKHGKHKASQWKQKNTQPQ